jgi:hypothetical protein
MAVVVLGALLGVSSPARADRVDKLIRKLHDKQKSTKVRLVACLVLRKYPGARSEAAFRKVLADPKENVRLRRFAALALASQGAHRAIPLLRRVAKSKNATLRRGAKRALARLCPSLRGKRVYADLTKVRGLGTRHQALVRSVRPFLYRQLSRIPGVAVGLPGCRKPSSAALSLRKISGYYLDTKVRLRQQKGRFSVKLNVLFTTYGRQQVKANAGASTAMAGSPSVPLLDKAIGALVHSLRRDIRRTVRPASPSGTPPQPMRAPRARP